jgi:hypothetical protein
LARRDRHGSVTDPDSDVGNVVTLRVTLESPPELVRDVEDTLLFALLRSRATDGALEAFQSDVSAEGDEEGSTEVTLWVGCGERKGVDVIVTACAVPETQGGHNGGYVIVVL